MHTLSTLKPLVKGNYDIFKPSYWISKLTLRLVHKINSNINIEILTLRISIFGGGNGIHCNPCLGLQSSASSLANTCQEGVVLARTGRAGSQFTLLLSLPFFLIKEEESTDGLFLVEVVFIVTLNPQGLNKQGRTITNWARSTWNQFTHGYRFKSVIALQLLHSYSYPCYTKHGEK